ncbi:hypothetical protein N7445_007538 [Penicillium cf. griseofulvum]|nr:hypothetical protein N7445_007538 [Penicillium cf. griseofulvum]
MLVLHLLTLAAGLGIAGARDMPTRRTSNTTSTLIATEYGTIIYVPVTIGNQSFMLLVDTSSSDTYVMQTGLTYRHGPNEMFGVKYGAGLASGLMAYEQVSIGGVGINAQKIGISNESNPMGDNVNSGLLGLGYPALTSAHPANHTSNSTY